MSKTKKILHQYYKYTGFIPLFGKVLKAILPTAIIVGILFL